MSQQKQFLRSAPLLLAAALMPATAHTQEVDAGAYLAGLHANLNDVYDEAAFYYTKAAASDFSNIELLQNVLMANIAKGDVKAALPVARRIDAGGVKSPLNDIVLLADLIEREDFAAAEILLTDEKSDFSPLMKSLMIAWMQIGQGRMSDGLASFDDMKEPPALELFGSYHKALALAMAGDFDGSDKILEGDERGNLRLNRGALIAHSQIMSQIGKSAEAIEVLNNVLKSAEDSDLEALRDRLAAGETANYDFVNSASEGAAEVFFTLASAYSQQEGERFALINARLAAFLSPDHVESRLLSAEILIDQEQFELANRAFAAIPETSALFITAELGRADALDRADRKDASIEVLRGLSRKHPENSSVFIALGDALRSEEDFAEAAEIYGKAIALIPEPNANHWFMYYARGISYEREKHWEKAEADFRKALELSPDQPLVLNYLGYSLVEMNLKMDEARKMIETAVRERPDDGYITDSLGWVLYRMGQFEEAVAPMERAVELVPDDPIINDHLGDVLWKVGRKLEAEFQWRRALSFEPEEKDLERIRRKLDVGLDAVLADEAGEAETLTSN